MRGAFLLLVLLSLSVSPTGVAADSAPVGNGVFRVIVEDVAGQDGQGVFSIVTGPGHSDGPGKPVLFAGAGSVDAASSFLTVRSYDTGFDYVQTTRGAGSGNLVTSLDTYGVTEATGSAGYRTTYALPGSGDTPDAMEIVSSIEVTGSTPADSKVVMTASVNNVGDVPLNLGVRYLLDLANGGDDGPAWREGEGPVRVEEGTHAPGAGLMTLAANAFGIAKAAVVLDGPAADNARFVSWNHAFPFAFDYTPQGRDVAGPCGVNDSAVLAYIGETPANAIVLAPGEAFTTSMTIAVGDATGFAASDSAACATAIPSPTPGPGQPTPPLQPAELPRTGGPRRER
jgi:hypothetical protein